MHNLHPGLILMAAGLLTLACPKKWGKWIVLAGSMFSLLAMMLLSGEASLVYHFSQTISMELLSVDKLSKAFGLIFTIIAVITAIYAMGGDNKKEQCASMLYAGSSLGVVFAGDFITLICFWEMMAAASTYLVYAGGTDEAKRASYRYLVMHLFGGNLLLAGVIALCSDGTFDLISLTGGSGYGYWFVLLGVAINAAIPPVHTWAPDAYPQSTVSGTVYMGSFTTKVAIYALIRLFAGTQELVLVGAVMAVFGACMALMENDLRKLLSYHIVSQLGMMVAALGTGLTAGIDGATLHAIYNILYKGVLLMGAGAIFKATGKRKITELGGLYHQMPFVSICFLIASLAIAGMPFLNGFASKALIMEALHEGHYTLSYWLVTVAGVGTWLSITMKINYFVFFRRQEEPVKCQNVPAYMKLAMAIGAALCILTGIFPDIGYSMMPGGTMAHIFTAEHILEYIGLFIGASVTFVFFVKKMVPHDQITLDFDWIYRTLFPKALTWISDLVYKVFQRFEATYNTFLALVKFILKHPTKIFTNLNDLKKEFEFIEDDEGAFEGDMPVGAFMQIFVIFCIVALTIVLIIE